MGGWRDGGMDDPARYGEDGARLGYAGFAYAEV